MNRLKGCEWSVVGIMLLTVFASSARAELLVLRTSGATGAAVGDRLSDDYVFKLPSNSELRLLKRPDNSPFVMRGPFEGTLSSFVASCGGVSAWTHDYCKGRGEDLLLGGTRAPVRSPQ